MENRTQAARQEARTLWSGKEPPLEIQTKFRRAEDPPKSTALGDSRQLTSDPRSHGSPLTPEYTRLSLNHIYVHTHTYIWNEVLHSTTFLNDGAKDVRLHCNF